MFDLGKLLDRLRARPYDEVRYRWDGRRKDHTVTVYLHEKKASLLLAEEFVLRVRTAASDHSIAYFDQDLWEKMSAGE